MRHTDGLHFSRSLSQITAQGKNNQEGGVSCTGNNLTCVNSRPITSANASGPAAQQPQQQSQQAQVAGDLNNSGAQCTGATNNCSPPSAVVEPRPAQNSPASGSERSRADDAKELSQGQRQICSGNASCFTSTGSGNTLVQTFNSTRDAPPPGQAQGPAGPTAAAPLSTASQSCTDKSACASTGPGGVVNQKNGKR